MCPYKTAFRNVVTEQGLPSVFKLYLLFRFVLQCGHLNRLRVYVVGSVLPPTGPFTQLIYKNINVPVYTTLKGVSGYLPLRVACHWLYCRWHFTVIWVFVLESHSNQQCTSAWWWLWLRGRQQLSGQFTRLHPESRQEEQCAWESPRCQERWGWHIYCTCRRDLWSLLTYIPSPVFFQVCPCPLSAQRVTMPFLLMPIPWTVITLNQSIKSRGRPPTPVKAPGLWVKLMEAETAENALLALILLLYKPG